MDVISFDCPDCGKTLRFPADKAGRGGRCRKCGATVRVPKSSQAIQDKQAKPAPAIDDDDDDDDGGSYMLADEPKAPEEPAPKRRKKRVDDDEEEENERSKKKPKKEKKKRLARYQKRTIQNAGQWKKVTNGMLLSSIGMWVLVAAWTLYMVCFIAGWLATPDYSVEARDVLHQNGIEAGERVVGRTEPLDLVGFSLTLAVGSEAAGRTLHILICVLSLVASGLFIAAYGVYLGIPNRYGTRGQSIALMTLGVLNVIILITFKLLPMVGAMPYGMMPYILPELALSPWNTERVLPLHVFWSWAPFWEVLLGLIFGLMWYAELSLFCIFLRAVALSLRDERLEPRSVTLIRTVLGVTFIYFSFYLLSITGTTVVLQVVLRCVYMLWLGFAAGFFIYAGMVLLKARTSVSRILEGVEDDSEKEDDDFEDEDDDF